MAEPDVAGDRVRLRAVLVIWRHAQGAAGQQRTDQRKWQLPQGLGLGFYDGVAGPGTGAFWTVSTLLLYPVDLVKASGVARSMNFVSNAVALSVFIFSGQVDYIIGLSMGLAVMLGAYFGAGTAIKGGAKFIRPVFITVVLGLTVRLAWQHWFGAPERSARYASIR